MNDLSKEVLSPALQQLYEIRAPLGRGGFADVYLATDRATENRSVALKLYRPTESLDPARDEPGERSRRKKEALALTSLQHPNIVPIYAAGELGGQEYLSMAFLEGGSLRDKLGGALMRQSDAIALVAVLADALHAAHEADLLHLDIKPENILFDRGGRPYLTDFGISRTMGGDGKTYQTRAMGTSDYASPEQRQGGALTPKSDIYSLGVVLFELLVGQGPLGPAPAIPQPPFIPPFPPNTEISAPRELVHILCKVLAAAPSVRYESAKVFAQRLREYLSHTGRETGSFTVAKQGRTHSFVAPNIARVHIKEPTRALRVAEGRRIPNSSREMANDLPAIPQGTRVSQMVYSHQSHEIGIGALVDQSVFARGRLRVRQEATVRGDLISLWMIDLSEGVQARNLIAPIVHLRGPIRLEGSIFCRSMHRRDANSSDAPARHFLPDGTELGGSLIVGRAFEKIVPDAAMGRKLTSPRLALPADAPMVVIGHNCILIGVLGDCSVVVEAHQQQLNTVRVTGDVRIGSGNTIRRIEGENVTIGPECVVDEVHARGKLIIEQGSRIGYVRAGSGIVLENHVTINSPFFFSDNGAIVENGEAFWQVGSRPAIPLTTLHLFDQSHAAGQGSLGTMLLDHPLYDLYEAIDPTWQPTLRPTEYQGTGEQVRQEARLPEDPFAEFTLDLTPASERPPARTVKPPPIEHSLPTEQLPVPPASESVTRTVPPDADNALPPAPSELTTRHLAASNKPTRKRRGPLYRRPRDE